MTMLMCGSNKPVDQKGFMDKFTNTFNPIKNLSEVDIIFEHGVQRTALPYKYDSEMDFTEGDGYAKVGFIFLDNEETQLIKFKLHQLSDENNWYRMCGNRTKFTLNLADNNMSLFSKLKLSSKDYMPESVQTELKNHQEPIYNLYIKPLIYNYERSLGLVMNMYKQIRPLQTDKNNLENRVALLLSAYKTGNIPQLRTLFDSLESFKSPHQMLSSLRPDNEY